MYVHVNAAMSVDGKLSTRRREQLRISGPADGARVGQIRAEVDAIVVGVGTVLADDPSLTPPGTGELVRVVLDSRARTPVDAAVLDGDQPTVICTSAAARPERLADLADAGASVVTAGEERVDPIRAFASLQEDMGVDRVLVEGGGEVIFSLFEADLVDELTVFVGPLVVGGRDAPTLADGDGFVSDFPELSLERTEPVDGGVVLYWRVERE